ncbi:MAG: DUF29 domain-containing protein [Kamptonema sp. SIO4C4]|nr:DUF29 domain-containing protein [Kamptonema sp. SIO4C4]
MKTSSENHLKNLYETDEHLWLEETIKILKDNRLSDLDIDNLIEELESLSKRDKNRVSSLLEQIIRHLLFLQYWTTEQERNRNHWRAEILGFRTQLKKYLTTNLYNYLTDEVNVIYQDALEYVQEKTGFSVDFPTECPYTLEQLLDKKWLNDEN